MKIYLVLIATLLTSPAFAIDSKKCSTMLNNGLFKKYTYGGIGEAYWNVCTQGTKKEGASTVTSDASTETSTMTIDTKYTSNVWTSQTQSTSSFGECSAFAQLQQLKKDREIYIAQNETEVLIDVARGHGEHLKVITFYSGCLPEAHQELSSNLQKTFSGHQTVPNSKTLASDIDAVILNSTSLKENCLVLL